ncbi:MAG: DUF1593 domain-containing protein [Verrucomicrobiales bacterium]|nr:DUF1593 domain-containing protein [Verrucomicrobiales bacterium]
MRFLFAWGKRLLATLGSAVLLPVFFCQAVERPRLAVLTDIGGDPDDTQSLIRLMVYSNAFRIELLLASASGTVGELKQQVVRPDLIKAVIDGYAADLPRLQKRAARWPEPVALRQAVKSGNARRGRKYIGAGHDTEGSSALIRLVDAGTREDPLNISIWGGQTDFAQALWRVKCDRSEEEIAQFIAKFRVYDIDDQDGIAGWMCGEFPGMHYILAKARPGRDKREGSYRGMYLTGDLSLTSREWVEQHVRGCGALGRLYPVETWTAPNPHGCLKEGDTPSWFFFLPCGGNDADHPDKPGWGGCFQREADGWWRDLPVTGAQDCRTGVSRWRPDFQKDFARRMAWCRE